MLVRQAALLLMSLSLSLLPVMVGCESLGGDDEDEVEVRGGERIGRPPEERGERADLDQDRIDSRIPRSAVLIRNWEGDRLSFRPRDEGTVYVLDVNEGTLVYSGHLQEGAEFALDARANRATLDGRTVFNRDVRGYHTYRVFFDRAGKEGRE